MREEINGSSVASTRSGDLARTKVDDKTPGGVAEATVMKVGDRREDDSDRREKMEMWSEKM